MQEKKYSIEDFLNIIKQLRDPEKGCPWDLKQTHESLTGNLIEESYEVVEAIEEKDPEHIKEELGDILLQVVLHAQIASEKGEFDFADVVDVVSEKMVYRHPHIFDNKSAKNAVEVEQNWEELKRKSKNQKTVTQSMKDIPKVFPAAMRCEKIQKKSSNVGVDYKNTSEAVQVVINRAKKLDNAVKKGNNRYSLEMLGDLFFAAIAVSRLLHTESEKVILQAGSIYVEQFQQLEALLQEKQIDLKCEPPEVQDIYREKVKLLTLE